jgi:hypothetical protein
MANICNFSMKIVGGEQNVDSFVSALEQEGHFCMGRGAVVDMRDYFDDGSILFGAVKWSLESSLTDNAVSMRKQKETGEGNWANDGFIDNHEFITLAEASEKFDVDVEAYSTEPGCGFAEHILVKKGKVIVNDSAPYQEIWFEDYANYEEFSKYCPNLAKEFDERAFEDLCASGDYQAFGGFESTEFSI